MPNCSSIALIVKSNGSKESERDLANFFERVHALKDSTDKNKGIFNAFLPVPDELYYHDQRLYDWACSNWGTKWDVLYEEIKFVADNHMTFETVGHLPIKWLEVVSKEYTRLVFGIAYSEQRMVFAAVAEMQDGEFISNDKIEVSVTRLLMIVNSLTMNEWLI